MDKVLFISGVYFQNNEWLSLGYKSDIGTAVMVNRGLISSVYQATLWFEGPKLVGFMHDQIGWSRILTGRFNDDILFFVKKYEEREDKITYSFGDHVDNIWTGEYEGDTVGNGVTRCSVTEVDSSFFSLQEILDTLKRDTVHEWPPGMTL